MKRKTFALIFFAVFSLVLCAAFVACDIPFLSRDSAPLPAPHLIDESEAEAEPVRVIDSKEERAVVGTSFYERQLSTSPITKKSMPFTTTSHIIRRTTRSCILSTSPTRKAFRILTIRSISRAYSRTDLPCATASAGRLISYAAWRA